MNDLETPTSIDDKMTVVFSRGVTRRSFLRRMMVLSFGLGAAASARLAWPGSASAATCTVYDPTWGCYCNPSRLRCGTDRCCNGQPCNGAAWRCDAWANGVCWCSTTCCLGGSLGFYSCCDGWKYGNYGSCGSGDTACLCAQWHAGQSC